MKIKEKLNIVWKDGKNIEIVLNDTPVASFYKSCVKHLKNIELSFDARQNPFDISKNNRNFLQEKLLSLFNNLNITLNRDKLSDQFYLNYLHDLYFTSFKADEKMQLWLDVHDVIHSLEDINNNSLRPVIWFDYKQHSGPLVKKFNRNLLRYAVTDYKKGDCYLSAFELGKTLYQYYLDGELEDVENVCRICKPWMYLRPVLNVALQDNPIKDPIHEDKKFLQWLSRYRDRWCEFYNLPDWQTWELSARLPVGKIEDVEECRQRFLSCDHPCRITI